jgi:DMSO/TMAO reductase YedYZ molybdopterin-dependent catalytic subunit
MTDDSRRYPDDLPDEPREAPAWTRPIGRRAFLGTIGAGLAGLVVLSKASGFSTALNNAVQAVKPGGGWRIYTVSSPMPIFDPKTFRLKITGQVAAPQQLAWDAVAALPGRSQTNDFHCVTGWSVMGVQWEGITPQAIVDLVKPTAKAKFVTMISAEKPYVDQISMAQFLKSGSLLARSMDGAPITREHGAPLRMVLPDMYGYKGVKWLEELRFDEHESAGYWEQRGYDTDAYVGRSNGY